MDNATDFSYIEAPKGAEKIKTDLTKPEATKQEIPISPKLTNSNGKYFSATALSKELSMSSKDLNNKIEKMKWIDKKNDEWVLTNLGKSKGALLKSGQYGDYIAYPDTVIKEII